MSEQSGGSTADADPAAIEAQIEATRARLAGTVDELAVRMRPQQIARRAVTDVKARLVAATTTPQGQLRVERVAAAGAAAVAAVAMALWRWRRR